MSTDQTNQPKPGTPSLETSVSKDETAHFQDGKATIQNDEGVSAQFEGKDLSDVKTGLGELPGAEDDGSDTTGTEGGETTKTGDEDGAETTSLPDWDPENEEVSAKYDEKYFREDGELDVTGSLSKEFWENYRKDPDAFKDPSKGGLDENTYAYLKSRLGLSKADVLQVERGQLAIAQQSEQKFYNDVGGKARWEAAVQWGREGGYTEAQVARFNKALEAGGSDAEDAVAALMGRYDAKFPRQQQNGGRRGPPQPRRGSTPPRDATRGAATGGTGGGSRDVFESAAAYNTAISEARKSGDQKLIDAVRAKGRRSNLS